MCARNVQSLRLLKPMFCTFWILCKNLSEIMFVKHKNVTIGSTTDGVDTRQVENEQYLSKELSFMKNSNNILLFRIKDLNFTD